MMIQKDWQRVLKAETQKDYYKELTAFIYQEYAERVIYPPYEKVFRALEMTSLADTKVVILGQDPYHNPGEACGLSFSVPVGQKVPPSLVNIYKELSDDVGCYVPNNGCLDPWAKQGVLLLNTVLTVRAGAAASHQGHGWEIFTDAILRALNDDPTPKVFLLFGRPAQSKKPLLTNPKHCCLMAPHPSPLSAYRGFFGCRVFSRANDFLKSQGRDPIDWQIPNV